MWRFATDQVGIRSIPPKRNIFLRYSMCSLAVSTQDSPAVEPRSNPGSGKIWMSENLRLYTTCVNHQHQPHWQFLVFSILSYFSRFETTLLSCTLFLESHLINTTSPHFQLPFIDIYYSLLLLLFYWNTAHKMVYNTANVFFWRNFSNWIILLIFCK